MDKKTIAYILIGGGAAVLLYMMLKKKDTTGGSNTTPVSSLASSLTGNKTPTPEEFKSFMDQQMIAMGWHQVDGGWTK